MKLPLLKDANVSGKRVMLRADLDVPLSSAKSEKRKAKSIEDDTRLVAALPTIKYLLKHKAKVIIAGHLGRPKGVDRSLSLEPIARWFFDCHPEFISGSRFRNKFGMTKKEVQHDMVKTKRGEFDGWEIGESIFLLENLRFNKGEENPSTSSGQVFAKQLASLADIYVNDAFAMCHRNHASIVGITHFLPHFAGLHLEEEITHLTKAMENPKRPLVVIVGGKKIETKLPLVEKMHRIADYVLVGGKIAQETKTLIKVQHEKVPKHGGILLIADSTPDKADITEQDAENFVQIIQKAKTIIWNGSMGIVGGKSENLSSEEGTRKITKGILESGAYSIVGGGDTTEYLNKLGVLDKFSFVSTGGGAMLAFLSGEKLPGIEALSGR